MHDFFQLETRFVLIKSVSFIYFRCDGNANLNCINVDDAAWSNTNWYDYIDSQSYFSEDCSAK